MNFVYKFILPLLSDKLTLDDISIESGFCGMATKDINRPYLDNHIFLIYAMDMTNKAIAIRKKLASLDIHNKIDCRIKGKPYRIFCFPIIGRTIPTLMSNIIGLTANETLQVYKFWKFTDDDINKKMIDITYCPQLFKESVIPEFDYSPDIKFDKEGRALIC